MTRRGALFRQWNDRISKITPKIYVGEIMTRAFPEFLEGIGVDTVISILSVEHLHKYAPGYPVDPRFKHHTFRYGDHDPIPPATMLEIVESFGETTLVHCISGSNRSTAVTLSRLIYEGMDPIEACHLYWTARGAELARVYKTMPKMSPEMLGSVIGFRDWLAKR